MKRDLKINYGILDDIINQLGIYKRSLSDMESSLSTITTYIEQNRGESIEEWKEKMKGSKEQMAEYETQINDLLNLFQGYVDDTTAYITPLQRNAMMRVDRNDIYWNLNQMESGIRNNVPKAISRTYKSPSFWGFWEDVTDTEKEASSINKSKIASIRSDIEQTNNRLNHKMDQLWDIYNTKVKKYENMDDEYNDKAAALKKKYTNFFEGFWDLADGTGKFVADLVVGLLKGLFIDIGWGLIKLVYDAGIIAVSAKIPDIIEPKFLKDAANERIDSFYTMVQQIVEDPFSVVEGMGQSISDSVEEDGIVYVTGGVAAGFVPIVGWSKYAKIGKVLDTDKPKKSVNKTTNKEGKMVDPVELLLVNAKKVGIEFTSGVINGMRIFKEILQGRTENVAFSGVPGGGNIYRVLNESDDTMRRANIQKDIDNGDVANQGTLNEPKWSNDGKYDSVRGYQGRDLSKYPKEYLVDPRLIVEMSYKGSNKSGTNASGWERNAKKFFNTLLKRNPEYWSSGNVALIKRGRVPIVDEQFIKHFPQYREYLKEPMRHHHIGEGGQAVALPKSLHPGYGGIHNVEKEWGITGIDNNIAYRLEIFIQSLRR